ncbi:MAG: hypothetical protein ABI703_01940 [Gemmatimonadales bacterium]
MASDDGGVGRPNPTSVRSDPGAVSGGAPSSRPAVREARLRAEFADKHPGIEPGDWYSAAGLAERLITRLLREGVSDEELPQRVLDPAHFEFRGGEGAPSRSNSPR